MKKKYYLIFILVVMFCFSIIRCGYAQAESTEETKLPEGLVIQSEKVKFLEVKESLVHKIRLKTNWGRIIYTENPNVIALFGYTKKDKYWLKVYDMKYKLIAEFQPQSENILIPKNKDIIWITGQGPQGGEVLNRSYWYEGLKQYDFSGKLLKTVDKEVTYKIHRIEVADNGDLYFLSLSNKDNRKKSLMKIDSNGNEIWKIPSNAHTIKVFGGGKYIISEGFIEESSNPQICIYNSDKIIQGIISDSKGTGLRCVGMSSDLRYLLISRAKDVIVYDTKDFKQAFEINNIEEHIESSIVSNDLKYFIYSWREKIGKRWVFKVKLIDFNNNVIMEYNSGKSGDEIFQIHLFFEGKDIHINNERDIIKLELAEK